MNQQASPTGNHWRRGGLPLVLAFFSLASQAIGSDATALLRFDRTGILDGEVWRLLTGNLVHLGWNHLLLNVTGLMLIWWLVGSALSPKQWLIVFTATCLGVTSGLLLWNPELRWYVGLSGTLHGLLLAGLIADIEHADAIQKWLIAGVAAKLAWEQASGPSVSTEALVGGTVIVDSHLYGAISGAILGLLFWGWDRRHAAGRRTSP